MGKYPSKFQVPKVFDELPASVYISMTNILVKKIIINEH